MPAGTAPRPLIGLMYVMLCKSTFLLALSIVGCIGMQAQQAGNVSLLKEIENRADDSIKLRLLLDLADKPSVLEHRDTLALVLHEAAKVYGELGLNSLALQTDRRALQLRLLYRDTNPEDYCKSAYNLAFDFNVLGQRDSAMHYFTEVIRLSPRNRQKSRSAYELGNMHKVYGEFALAVLHGREALRFAQQDTLHNEIQNAYTLILDTYTVMLHQGDTAAVDSILRFIPLPKQYYASFPEPDSSTLRNYALIFWYESHAYKFRNDYRKAEKLLSEAQTLFVQSGVDDKIVASELLNSRGILLRRIARYPEAFSALNSSLAIRTAMMDSINMAVTHNNLGDLFFNQKRYLEALRHYHASVQLIAGRSLGDEFTALPSSKLIQNHPRLLDAFRYIGFKADAWRQYCEDSGNPVFCEEALRSYALADSLVDILRSGHLKEGSKLFWREDAKRLYSGAIDAALQLEEFDQALYFSDRSKAVLVLDAVREHMMRSLIAGEIKEQKDGLEERIRLLEISGLGGVQQDMVEDEAIIQYFDTPESRDVFETPDTLYAFVITRTDIKAIGLNKPAVVEALRHYQEANRAFLEKGIVREESPGPDRLYLLLISPLEPLPKHITIIPDGAIAQIGFDGLRDQNGNYLIESKAIRYDLSLAMAQEMSQMEAAPHARVLGFAPMTEALCAQVALPYTRTELNGIASTVKSRVFLGKQASKSRLLDLARDFSVLHFATHASADIKEPAKSWIALSGDTANCDFLYVQDLYAQHLPSSMVVVSACEGAYGVYASGEGAMSVARGFAYAGAASIVTSLWQVNDKATADIMKSYYTHLTEGLSKSEALRQAKLDYIHAEGRRKMELHPAWWSAFIVIGNDSPIEFEIPKRLSWLYFIIPGVVALMLIAIYRLRVKTQQA